MQQGGAGLCRGVCSRGERDYAAVRWFGALAVAMRRMQQLMQENPDALERVFISFDELQMGAPRHSHLLCVSHRWESKAVPDLHGVQLKSIKEYLRAQPSVTLVWYGMRMQIAQPSIDDPVPHDAPLRILASTRECACRGLTICLERRVRVGRSLSRCIFVFRLLVHGPVPTLAERAGGVRPHALAHGLALPVLKRAHSTRHLLPLALVSSPHRRLPAHPTRMHAGMPPRHGMASVAKLTRFACVLDLTRFHWIRQLDAV